MFFLTDDRRLTDDRLTDDSYTLDEWKLVLYGTQTSPDDDDPAKEIPNPGVEVDHVQSNVVDTEGDPWTGSQRVDQASHPEVQQTETEDQSGAACTNLDGSQCLGAFCLILLLLISYMRDPSPYDNDNDNVNITNTTNCNVEERIIHSQTTDSIELDKKISSIKCDDVIHLRRLRVRDHTSSS